MSNYPSSPSPFPQGPQNTQGFGPGAPGYDSMGILRKASVLLFIIGGLLTMLGTCNLLAAISVPADELMARQREVMGCQQQEMLFSPTAFKAIGITVNAITMILGLAFITGGALVRGGKRSSVIGMMILCALLLFFCGLMILAGLVGLAVNPLLGGTILCTSVIPTIMLSIAELWLFQGLKGAGAAMDAQQQFQMQMWQHQQMQQAYSQSPYPPAAGGGAPTYGYGYGVPQQPPQQAQPPSAQPQAPTAAPPSDPAGGTDAPPRQE